MGLLLCVTYRHSCHHVTIFYVSKKKVVNWNEIAQERVRWRDFVKRMLNRRFQ